MKTEMEDIVARKVISKLDRDFYEMKQKMKLKIDSKKLKGGVTNGIKIR
jgi:hypothetical protein